MHKTFPSLPDSFPELLRSFFIDTSFSGRAGCHPVTVCCNETIQKCIPKLCSWLVDQIENMIIYEIYSNYYLICIVPPNKFGDLRDIPYDTRLHPRYTVADHISDIKYLESNSSNNVYNA